MHRFYLPPPECQGTDLTLTGREAHHGLHVLRLRSGDTAVVLDGEGQTLSCQVAQTGRDRLVLTVLKRHSTPRSPFQITLAQAIPKGKLFEDIIQKATELAAFCVVPLITARVIGRNEGDQKLEKWKLAAIEAIKQCGSPWLPRIEPPATLQTYLSRQPRAELALFGALQQDARHPRTYFESFERENRRRPETISVAIGPEGDFTPEEVSELHKAEACPISLGPLVLRTDTASLYCLSVINYELQYNISAHR